MELVMEPWQGPCSIDRFMVFSGLLEIVLQRLFYLHNCIVPRRQLHILSLSNWLMLRFHIIKLLQKGLLERLFIKGEKKDDHSSQNQS